MIEVNTLPNRSSFVTYSARSINSSLPATQLSDVNIPDGYTLVVRANPGNTSDIFLADSSAKTNVATTRITLNPGDSVSLNIQNANLVYVLGEAASQNVDYIVEQ